MAYVTFWLHIALIHIPMTKNEAALWWMGLNILDKYKYMDSIGIRNKPVDTVSIDEIMLMYGETL